MIYISHRGNLTRRNLEEENKIYYVEHAIKSGFYCEIDLWFVHNQIFSGHDYPKYNIAQSRLIALRDKLLCHTKNPEAIEFLQNQDFHYFWHESDKYTFSNRGIPIVLPGQSNISNAIYMLPEHGIVDDAGYGICSDFIMIYTER